MIGRRSVQQNKSATEPKEGPVCEAVMTTHLGRQTDDCKAQAWREPQRTRQQKARKSIAEGKKKPAKKNKGGRAEVKCSQGVIKEGIRETKPEPQAGGGDRGGQTRPGKCEVGDVSRPSENEGLNSHNETANCAKMRNGTTANPRRD